jgi:hypothetical protein
LFYIAAGIAVLVVCVIDELFLLRPIHEGTPHDVIGGMLGAGALRGFIISICIGLGILFWISVLIETGDKFGGFACVFIGLATLYGPLAGAIVRGIGEWLRKRAPSKPWMRPEGKHLHWPLSLKGSTTPRHVATAAKVFSSRSRRTDPYGKATSPNLRFKSREVLLL